MRRREDFADLHTLHSVAKLLAIHLVTIAQKIGGRGVVREGVHDLLGGPGGGGMLGDVEVDDAPAVVGEHDETKRTRRRAVGTVKKSIETKSRTWLTRNVRQV